MDLQIIYIKAHGEKKGLELFAPSFYAIQCFFCFLVAAEGGEADVSLAGGTETDTRGTDDVGTVEQGLEELPGRHAVGTAHPDVGGILAAIALVAEGAQGREHLRGGGHRDRSLIFFMNQRPVSMIARSLLIKIQ